MWKYAQYFFKCKDKIEIILIIIATLRIVPWINGCIWTSLEKYIYGLWGVTEIFKKEKEQNSNALNEDWKL